jgi:hypothetical protein
MSFKKYTHITGRAEDGKFKYYALTGHRKVEAALKYALNKKISNGKIEHRVLDLSGNGRGGHDGRWDFRNGEILKTEEWREGHTTKIL